MLAACGAKSFYCIWSNAFNSSSSHLKTLVLQSHTQPLPHAWLKTCIDSVKHWAHLNHFDYLFLGDELFNYISKDILDKTIAQPVIATDLARLIALQDFLNKGFDQVIWCDADFLIFAPTKFSIRQEAYLLGREVWIQKDSKSKLTVNTKVHNAFMLFQQDNVFLKFYIDSAKRLLSLNKGSIPPQFIGPKFLTAIHNIIQCPVLETAGMLSPLVIHDIVEGKGSALTLFKQRSSEAITAANLCSSLCDKQSLTTQRIETCISTLLNKQSI